MYEIDWPATMFVVFVSVCGLALLVCVAGLAFCHYMLWRNELVYKTRIRCLDRSADLYVLLPSYDDMMKDYFRFTWYVDGERV